jgi:signal recognition particle subunit SRP54
MFETLSDRLGGVLKNLRNRGRLTQQDVTEVLAEVRTALLEADVNVTVVRDVVERIRSQAVGATSSTALNPGQQIIKIAAVNFRPYCSAQGLRGAISNN